MPLDDTLSKNSAEFFQLHQLAGIKKLDLIYEAIMSRKDLCSNDL